MKYGLYIPPFGPYGDARTLASLARDAEDAGWDGFFIWDHIAGHDLAFTDTWVALAAVALATTRIRIGTTVTPVPRRRPWKLARETVAVDRLSNGRLILGVGIGVGDPEWGDLGEETKLRKRAQMLDEGLDILVGLWSGEPFSYEGRYYRVSEAHFLPKPLQSPRIPIWVGGFWPNRGPFDRAARWDGVFPLYSTWDRLPDQLREVAIYIKSSRDSDAPFDIISMGVTPTPDEGLDDVAAFAEAGATWWLEAIAPFRYDRGFDEPWPVEALRERVLQGPPRLG